MNNLVQRTFIAPLQLIISLGVLIFLSAWTINFWQAWVYLFIFGLSFMLNLFYLYKNDQRLLQRRLNVVEKEIQQKRTQLYISVAYLTVLFVSSLDHRFLWSEVPFSVVMTGDIFVILGYFIIFIALRDNAFAATTIEVFPDHKVVSSGLYAIIRHPMYLGAIIMLLGTPLALGSWWGILTFIPIIFLIVRRLFEEEKILSQHLSGYKEYCQNVKCYLVPFIW